MPGSSATTGTTPATVGGLGERAILDRIHARVPPPPPWVATGIGDDAAIVEPARNTLDVLTTDALVEGVHFDRRWSSARDIGFRALAVNLSDVAAMGASPRAALLSLILPADLPVADLDDLLDGFLAAAQPYGLALVGGNVTASPGPLIVDVTVTGAVRPRRMLLRGGARPGDELYVSGEVGAGAAGLDWLRAGAPGRGDESADVAQGFSPAVAQGFSPALKAGLEACAARYLRPEARVRLGGLVGRNRAASACVDLSDGLADAVRQIASAGGVGAAIEAEALPLNPAAERWSEARGIDPIQAALTGGDDYELLFAVPRRRRRKFLAVSRLVKSVPVTRIGAVTAATDLVLRRGGADHPLPQGFTHFVATP
jgi:thiamine-monophosphate kinase